MINSNKSQSFSVVNSLVKQQIGLNINKSEFSYFTTLDALQNLKPTITLEKCNSDLNNQISLLQFNNKGNLLASTYFTNNSICVWNWLSEVTVGRVLIAACNYNPQQINWLPADDENTILVGGSLGNLEIIDITTQSNRSLLNSNTERFIFCVHNNLPFTILTATEYGKIVNIDIRQDHPQDLLTVKQDNSDVFEIYGIDINPSKPTEFCIAGLKSLRIYDTRNLSNPVKKLFSRKNTINKCRNKNLKLPIKYNYNGSEILVSFPEEPIYLFNTSISNRIKTYATDTSENIVNFIGTRSEFIITFSTFTSNLFIHQKYPHTLCVWQKDAEKLIRKIKIEEKCWGFDVHQHKLLIAINKSYEGLKIWK